MGKNVRDYEDTCITEAILQHVPPKFFIAICREASLFEAEVPDQCVATDGK